MRTRYLTIQRKHAERTVLHDGTPFRYVVLDSPAVARIAANPRAFREQLVTPDRVAVFDNLGRDAVLVAPRPRDASDAWGHLARFLRTAPPEWQRDLWAAAGRAALDWLGHDRGPLWLSTSGLGVPWLHLRLDSRPKYVTWGPYRVG